MDKYVLKASGNCKSIENGNMSLALKANIGLKISAKAISTLNDDAKFVNIKKSLAVGSDKWAKYLNSKTFQPLFIDSIDSRPAINGTSSNICDDENVQPQSNNEGTSPIAIQFSNANLMDNMTSTPIDSQISAMNGNTGTPKNHHLLARLHRDLDSPSAATRMRAIRALRSPTNEPYNQFDIPHEEQDIITEEERRDPVPKTIQDVMKNVIAYVEIRSGDENRTTGIKSVIAELGATVNDNFNRNTTHVIFKDGVQSTYNKAKNWNIPIVSILWIEACKKQLRLVDPVKYPILNIERYENPELYKKVKIKKFLQTEHELKIKKPKKNTQTVEKFHSIRVPKKAKDNLTGILNDFRDRLVNNSDGIDYFSKNSKLAGLVSDGASTTGMTKTLPKAKRALYSDFDITGLNSSSSKSNEIVSNDGDKTLINSTTRSLVHQPAVQDNGSVIMTPCKTLTKRKTMFTPKCSDLEKSANSVTRITRRTSMLMLNSPSVDQTPIEKAVTGIDNINDNRTKNISEEMEITLDAATPLNTMSLAVVHSPRKTVCVTSAMDMTKTQPTLSSTQKRRSVIPSRYKDFELNEESKSVIMYGTETENKKQSQKPNSRRTLFTPNQVTSTSSIDEVQKSTTNRRRTLFTPSHTTPSVVSTLSKDDEAQKTASSRRRTLFATNNTTSRQSAVSTLAKTLTPSLLASKVPSSFSTPNTVHDPKESTLAKGSASKANELQIAEIASVPSPNPAAANKLLLCDNLTPQSRTLFEEYSQRLTFSSTNKRRSVFDVSMHIIEQRLKNINEMARLNRSVSESDVDIDAVEKCVTERLARSSPQLGLLENGGVKQKRMVNDDEIPVPKKRKLFDPTTYEEQAANTPSIGNNNNKASNTFTPKNGPSVIHKIKSIKSTTPRINKLKYQRQSLMDFQTNPSKPVKVYASTTKTIAQMNHLAYTNMRQDQINVINQAITTLGNFTIESEVTKKTTHLVTIDSKRTQKFLRAIIRGLWILNFDWVTTSLSAGVWVHEEPFENRSFSKAVSMCRAEAQAFGSKYKINIFAHLDPIYISTKCRCKDLNELYTMCGGRVTNRISTAKYIVTDKPRKSVNQLCLHSNWILDSITIAECKNPLKYTLKFVEQVDLP